jgi:hypothetical protein
VQERLVLKEVGVAPRLLGVVVHGTVGLGAVRAREAAALREIDLDVETMVLGIEVSRLDHPRRDEAESELQKVGVAHIGAWGWSIVPASVPSVRSALKDKSHLKEDGRALSSASLTAARPVDVSLCHEDKSAPRPFARATRSSEEAVRSAAS